MNHEIGMEEIKNMKPKTNKIHQDTMVKIAKRAGQWLWDGVFYNRDSITNPVLTILHNKAGREIREQLKLIEIENCRKPK
jgi:hypothetical protein